MMRTKSIPWLTVSVAVVIGVSIITFGFSLMAVAASPLNTSISAVRLTNVRDTSFTVSWLTDQAATGEVHYGLSPDNLDQIAGNDRGNDISNTTHHVTLHSLAPDTLYYFDVVSAGERDDNGGTHHTVTTGPTLGLPSSETIYGQIFLNDGLTPAAGTIVYITVFDDDGMGSTGQAAEMSSLVDENGYWFVNLGNVRFGDLSGYFDYDSAGDGLELEIEGAGDGSSSQTVSPIGEGPIPPVLLPPTAVHQIYLPTVLK